MVHRIPLDFLAQPSKSHLCEVLWKDIEDEMRISSSQTLAISSQDVCLAGASTSRRS